MNVLLRRMLPIALALAVAPAITAQSSRAPCTQTGHTWVCNPAMLQKAIAEARTVNIELPSMERNSRMQLERLATSLGKTVVEGPADLTLTLVQVNTAGVNIGPAGTDLATLSVYAPGPEHQHGPLVWSETYNGQPDMAWPSIVHALITQFRAAVEKK